MTHNQLSTLLISGDSQQVLQAINYFEQQKQILPDLLTECFIAFQLIEDKSISKKLINLFKLYTPNNFQIFLKPKYLLSKQYAEKGYAEWNESSSNHYIAERQPGVAKTKKMLKELDNYHIIDLKQFIYALFPYFPELLWTSMQELCSEQEKDLLFQHPKMLALKKLDLEEVKLNKLDERIQKLTELDELYISNLNLSKVDLSFLKQFPKLKILVLQNCKISQLPKEIEALTQLETLILNQNPLDKTDLNILSKLTNLKNLQIWWFNKFRNFEDLKNAERLNLFNVNITNLPQSIILFLKLIDLVLAGNNLSKADFTILGNLSALRSLDLTQCALIQLKGIEKIMSLKNLYLRSNYKLASINELLKLPNLFYVNLKHCNVIQIPKNLEKVVIDLE